MTRPAVLVVTEVFPPRQGGSGRWLWELYRRVSGFDVAVIAGPSPGAAKFDSTSPLRTERFQKPAASWGLLSTAGAPWYLGAIRQVREAIRRNDPVAVHCGKCLPEGLVALAARGRKKLPIQCFAHGEELTLARTSGELRALTNLVLRRVDRLVANSDHTRRILIGEWGLDPAKVAVLTPGVDTTRFAPAAPDPQVRHRLGWFGRDVVLTAGALQRRKGQDTMIRALPAIRRACPGVLYAMVGEGWERRYLESLARDLGVFEQVQFLGVLGDRDLVHCYQQCDLFVLANRQVGWDFEGFGIVLLEAQACGKPVIAGASGGTVEAIDPGRTGELVSPDDPESLASACVDFLADPERRTAYGARGRVWAEQRFDWSNLARRAEALILSSR